MIRFATFVAASLGAILCIATAVTGAWFGILSHRTDPSPPPFNIGFAEVRSVHLKLAIVCVAVSLVAHVLSLAMLRKMKKA
jgi:hypothetical protein